jgi:transcriptional regulator of arginine metabolism
VASALDRAGLEGAIGTVAGDDTVLVVATDQLGGEKLGDRIEEIAGARA